MQCISVSYKNADSEIRGRFAFSTETRKKIITKLCSHNDIAQCVILCTCNRTEIYFENGESSRETVIDLLSEYSGFEKEQLLPYIRSYCGDSAIRHIFRVACGIDSMVIGEDEILGQFKSAYYESVESNAVSYEFNMIFQAAISCAKKIKTETALSKASVSTATLAANEAARFGEKVNVLLIGSTGKIGHTVLKNLLSHKNVNVTCTRRQHSGEFKIHADSGINIIDYSDRFSFADKADCIISATSSPHYTITLHDLKKHITTCKNRLFIDLAVPVDIDSEIVKISGAKIIGIDYFEHLAEENNALKLNSAEEAEKIILEEIDILKKDFFFHDFLPLVESVSKDISEKLLYKLKSELNSNQLSAVLNVIKEFGNGD